MHFVHPTAERIVRVTILSAVANLMQTLRSMATL